MALRDTWHRALLYFGLAEEEDERYQEDRVEPEPQPEAERRVSCGRSRTAKRASRSTW